MPIDRDATLKRAEKLLRQGKLEGAIAEYVRLVQEQPKDWNSVNALGDVYVRAGQPAKAVEQFTAIADYLVIEGFLSRAAALYKKILKIRSDDEHSQLQLAGIATSHRHIADAMAYLKQVGAQRRLRGDVSGALEIAIRLGTLDPDDADAKLAAARAARQTGDAVTAATLLAEAADVYEKKQRADDARGAWLEALELDPDASDDPRLLLVVAQREFEAGRFDQGRAALTRVLMASPECRKEAVAVGCDLVRQGNVEAGFLCVDLAADLALMNLDAPGAVAALQAFTDLVPDHSPALMKLVEVCVDGNLDDLLAATQAKLADAYLSSGHAAAARVIAEDLMARHPSAPENIERFRRALVQLGEADPDAIIAARCASEHALVTSDGEVDLSAETVETPPAVPASRDPAQSTLDADVVTLDLTDIDLRDALADLAGNVARSAQPAPAASSPQELESVFADFRGRFASEDDAAEHYRAGREHLRSGRRDEAIRELEAAAKAPVMRFLAAAALGRLHISAADLSRGVEWLECAAGAPPPTLDEGHALLFELAVALERIGERARALAILLELSSDAPGYRDVDDRVNRLARIQAGE